MGIMQTDGRQETPNERADRNWNELLQELRVMQTGVQILTGFLLTLPFQSRFADLDQYQVNVYLALVIAAVIATALIVAPVSVHRVLFRKQMKGNIVTLTDRITRIALAVLALVITGVAVLVFDVVVGRTAGIVAGSAAFVLMALLWLLLPETLRRRGHAVDDLVEFATVEPHAAARRAVVDLDALALGHDELGLVDRTLHGILLGGVFPAQRTTGPPGARGTAAIRAIAASSRSGRPPRAPRPPTTRTTAAPSGGRRQGRSRCRASGPRRPRRGAGRTR